MVNFSPQRDKILQQNGISEGKYQPLEQKEQ